MSPLEAMIRFLKAKVRVMQEELDQLNEDNRQKVREDMFTINGPCLIGQKTVSVRDSAQNIE